MQGKKIPIARAYTSNVVGAVSNRTGHSYDKIVKYARKDKPPPALKNTDTIS